MVSAEEQVQIEAELAKRLLRADTNERRGLYGEVYDEIYSMHLSRDPETLEFGASPMLIPFLLRLADPGQSVLDVGCGTGLMAIELARAGRLVTGIDVSRVALHKARSRGEGVRGLEFTLVTGVNLPYGDAVFNFAYSIEVLEHLHERDVKTHFTEIRRVLSPGGRYWFLTPNASASVSAADRFGVSTPVDADVHLKEWTYQELEPLLREIGFSRIVVPFRVHRALSVPAMPIRLVSLAERLRSPRLHRYLGLGGCSVVAVR
jgi:ubiquinone/menaquinone biosynthesis C-methylase UbiE